MLRFVVIAVALVVLVLLLRGALRRTRGDRDGDAARRGAPPPAPTAESMVACTHCGVHLPRGEAIAGPDGRVFCSDAHRAAHARGEAPPR